MTSLEKLARELTRYTIRDCAEPEAPLKTRYFWDKGDVKVRERYMALAIEKVNLQKIINAALGE